MILVEVCYRVLNRTYDFRVDETVPIGELVSQMVRSISQSERIPLAEDYGLFMLGDQSKREIFHPSSTLAENGVRSGATLFLL
ncbi:MAG: EsaB/YukD family protein [Lachnospiraceae bacterium]|nr:EsaB/YukD family protein [Lachnospiraceae bacterium]